MWGLPKHLVSRRVALAWLFVCLASLIVMLGRMGLHADRTALSTLVPMYWASLPLGHAGMMAIISLRTKLYVAGAMPSIVTEGLASWLVLGMLGYVQWFLLLPLIARQCQQLMQYLFNHDVVRKRSTR